MRNRALPFLLFTFLIFTAATPKASAQNVMLYSRMWGKCLNAQGGGNAPGTQLIGYMPCSAASNEIYWFNQNGTISQGNKCLDARGGQGHDGDPIILYNCTGAPNQIWHMNGDGTIRGINGKCIDLEGGPVQWINLNQRAILYTCNGAVNQQWMKGVVAPKNQVKGIQPTQPGTKTDVSPINMSAADLARNVASGKVIGAGAGNVIGAGAGNVIGAGAGNVVVFAQP
ncbi:MAG: ricin-type beta-trefoil lectin domain protein [Acidobacteriales bacterium]|nr:ricin-type beta-trefoil lectin domain protein [Terriglobales bacterium]